MKNNDVEREIKRMVENRKHYSNTNSPIDFPKSENKINDNTIGYAFKMGQQYLAESGTDFRTNIRIKRKALNVCHAITNAMLAGYITREQKYKTTQIIKDRLNGFPTYIGWLKDQLPRSEAESVSLDASENDYRKIQRHRLEWMKRLEHEFKDIVV